ncbi:cell division-specific peptidoglycanbiosynthesis regulator FtsW [Mizugakiibacter sediminis]|uniref:Probable peptidoglycan glycosyltransferase FtsW n=1 Tax=Mizugakiibacter sediminis TaxID=1475481 RepID=A0A0K8QRZ6_9GAMM|nr:putative lipid II flippase FtsW [Mizugakiibacter sediminis]GAP67167.1 cell division-specific peptidoglycanbiosynthesis regulator FtsW [Mizugakiibacter sediminis]
MLDWLRQTQAIRRQGPQGHWDAWLLFAAIALASIGVVMVASSSIAVADGEHIGAFYYLKKHLMFLGLGTALAAAAARTELKHIEKYAFLLMLLAFIALLLVFLPGIGMRINGARRWINLLVLGFQPVEAVKLVVVIYLASYLVRHRDGVEHRLFGVVKPIGVAGLVVLLLLAQPDFGSAALIVSVSVGMIWLGGARMRNLLALGAPLVPALAWAALTEDYRIKRLTSFLDPWKDPFNDGFQLTQALIAIGRGEWFGVGLGGSVQKLFYLPEAHTDFILAVIAEELGLAGILLVLGLFALLVGRGLWLGLKGVELGQRFAGYVAFGLSLTLGLQALVSVGVNLGVLPTKGLTLPLISSGGSSVLMTCAMVGVLLRAGYEITRAEDTRRMATRVAMPAAQAEEVGA